MCVCVWHWRGVLSGPQTRGESVQLRGPSARRQGAGAERGLDKRRPATKESWKERLSKTKCRPWKGRCEGQSGQEGPEASHKLNELNPATAASSGRREVPRVSCSSS